MAQEITVELKFALNAWGGVHYLTLHQSHKERALELAKSSPGALPRVIFRALTVADVRFLEHRTESYAAAVCALVVEQVAGDLTLLGPGAPDPLPEAQKDLEATYAARVEYFCGWPMRELSPVMEAIQEEAQAGEELEGN